MPLLELYETKVLHDEELPVQLGINRCPQQQVIFPGHWHEHIELHYIMEGGGDFYIDQRCVTVREGDLLIVNSGELHTGYCTDPPYCSFVIIADPADLSAELGNRRYQFATRIREDGTVRHLVERIADESERQDPGYKPLCRALTTELLVYLCRQHATGHQPERVALRRKNALERLEPVLHYIEMHLAERITVEELARQLCLSEDRFGHLFREGVGLAPLQYINEVRLRKAMTLLQTEAYTVTEIAEAVGFRDYNHFGRLFRKRYGCTPNRVRRTADSIADKT